MQANATRWADLLGLEFRRLPWRERWISGVGGVVAIALVLITSRAIVGDGAGWVVASMGASTVLLFAVPHGPLSQPWQVLAGHVVPAIIGVACARWIPDPVIAGALAVGIAIVAMRGLGCIHPPGGATALAAVIGGPEIQALGFTYVLYPVLLNLSILLGIAVLFNYPFARRRTEKSGLLAFRRWAKYQVTRNENSWQRVGAVEGGAPIGESVSSTSTTGARNGGSNP